MTNLQKIAFDALREMYQEAEPPLDFDHAIENPDKYEDNWYSNHELCPERQKEIVEKHCEGKNLTSSEHTTVVMTAILNYGPKNA